LNVAEPERVLDFDDADAIIVVVVSTSVLNDALGCDPLVNAG
jgi:hypothetical protein